ncbi:amidohydrolase family protein [Kordiimonas aquimaris]|uniref:amidohydrolase family protein n=1 Tax=Kordiimonas aquimaris TaxID=707591 RepID=UPI0021CE9A34|nr:amidohydrolase family protein [Kordiimonas aquimaris]
MLIVWFATAVLWPVDAPVPNVRAAQMLITNVNVVDVETGNVINDQQILIKDGDIVFVGDRAAVSDIPTFDGRGRYAVPGLFDMHAHSIKMSPMLTHPLFIASGVTAIRDINGCMGIDDPWVACADEKRAWNAAVKNAEIVGPRYDQVTSLAINGGSEIPDDLDPSLGGATPEGAVARVAYDKARGIDYLKSYTQLPRDSYFALTKAAHENDMYVAGHLPIAVSGFEAVEAGQRSFEHALLFVFECYPDMSDLRGLDDFFAHYTYETRLKMIAEHDKEKCADLMKVMADAGTAYVPTHTTRKLDAFALDPAYRNDPRLKYIPAPLRMLWLNDADNMARKAGNGGQESYMAIYRFGLEQTGIAHRAGVTVLAGTDAPDSFAFPGLGLADELEHLVEAGLSPFDALQSATIKPAAFLGLHGRAGVIKSGARADIVLLDANPLEDIKAVRSIDTVILAGHVYDREDLDGLLNGVEQVASAWYMWPKFIWQALNSPIMRKQFAD